MNTKTRSSKTKNPVNQFATALFAAAAVLLVFSAPLEARNNDLKITYKKSQLKSSEAARDLYALIENKVEHYCVDNGTKTLERKRNEQLCIGEMMDRTIKTISNKRLTAIHNSYSTERFAAAP